MWLHSWEEVARHFSCADDFEHRMRIEAPDVVYPHLIVDESDSAMVFGLGSTGMRPGGPLGFEHHSFLCQRMLERDLPGVQAQRRCVHGKGLRLADLAIGQIGGVTGDRPCLGQRAWPLAEVSPGE